MAEDRPRSARDVLASPFSIALPGASERALLDLESDFDLTLPEEYRAFLAGVNGGVLREHRLQTVPGDVVFVEVLFGAGVGEPELPFAALSDELRDQALDDDPDEARAAALRERLDGGEDLDGERVPVPLDLGAQRNLDQALERLPSELLAIGAEHRERELLCVVLEGPDAGAVLRAAYDDPEAPRDGMDLTIVSPSFAGFLQLVHEAAAAD